MQTSSRLQLGQNRNPTRSWYVGPSAASHLALSCAPVASHPDQSGEAKKHTSGCSQDLPTSVQTQPGQRCRRLIAILRFRAEGWKCEVSNSTCVRGRMDVACSSEPPQQLEHHRLRVRADYGATGNLPAPAPTNLLSLRGVSTAAPPALQQQPLIKLALLTSAAAQQLICSAWPNKHSNTSQRSCRTARTPSSCQPRKPGRAQLLGRIAPLAEGKKKEYILLLFVRQVSNSSAGNQH